MFSFCIQVKGRRVQAQRTGSNKLQSPQFYSSTLTQPIGRPDGDNIHFQSTRRNAIHHFVENTDKIPDHFLIRG
jgi:hypothetical protein